MRKLLDNMHPIPASWGGGGQGSGKSSAPLLPPNGVFPYPGRDGDSPAQGIFTTERAKSR